MLQVKVNLDWGEMEEDAAVFFFFLTRWDLLLSREGGPTRCCEFSMLKPSLVFVDITTYIIIISNY